MAVGIEDVARAAGVSTATVSRALRGVGSISAATTERVRQTAAKLGYVPLPSAVALARGRTHAVGLIAPSVSRWFYATVIGGAESVLRAAGFDALLHLLETPWESHRESLDTDVLRRRVDAVIVAGLSLSTPEVQALKAMDVPVVSVSARHEGLPYIGIDDDAAERALARRVIAAGHRLIGHIGGPTVDDHPCSTAAVRRNAWLAVMDDAGLEVPPSRDQIANYTFEGGWQAAHVLLDAAPETTAVLVDSDEMAMGVIHALHERGVRPGADVSVTGFDGHELCTVVGLATVEQPTFAQGRLAGELVLSCLAGSDLPDEVMFGTRFVERPSLRPPRADGAGAVRPARPPHVPIRQN